MLLETPWVLESVCRFASDAVLDAIERLRRMPPVRFEADRLVVAFIREARGSKLGLADALIGLWSRELGCQITWTFDKKAAASDLFQEIE